jgi:uncharacterized protein (TIGR02300 family)
MVKPEWGMKRICPSCGARYYDLHREPVMCPKCGAAFDPETLTKTRRAKAMTAPEAPIEPIADEELETDIAAEEGEGEEEGEELPVEGAEAEEGEEEEEEEVIEDASELGEDEDDMAEVIENVEDDEER